MSETQTFIIKEEQGLIGINPKNRPTKELITYGIINIDKPKGPTSHQVSDYLQKILNIKKAGHSGTLDPGVTGVQPITLGKATRMAQYLLTAPKEYICVMHIHKKLSEAQIKSTLGFFIGKIKQLPPIKSAVKREERVREIYELEILEIIGQEVLFRVKCQAGTYIRKLCLHSKTGILTKNGLMSASDLFSNHSTIYSCDNGKMIEKKPSAFQKIKSPSKLLKINMDSGISYTITKDHEMLTSKTEGYQMMEAKNLKKGNFIVKSLHFPQTNKELIVSDFLDEDYYIQEDEIKQECKIAFISKYGSIREMNRILNLDRKSFLAKSNSAITIKHLKLSGIYDKVKRRIHTFKTQKGKLITIKNFNKDLFYLLGLIASDGNNTKEKKTVRYTRIKFHNKEEILVNEFLKKYKKLFPVFPITKKRMTPNLWEIDTSNSFLATIAASLGIKSPQKNSDLLPILNAKSRLIKSFLKGYFDGDGSVYFKKRSKNNSTRISFHTINKTDAIRIHAMLLKVGISSKIFQRNINPKNISTSHLYFEVSVGNIPAQKKFINDIGTNHPKKKEKFKQILKLKNNAKPEDHYYVGLHFKEKIRKNQSKLHKMGGNLNRVLSSNIPITRGFYKKASNILNLPKFDDFIIEKIKSIEEVKGVDQVYDMTVPKTHNFLIETGFVSSNCHDIGEHLGCGAHMANLRRSQAGPFRENNNLVTLQDLTDAVYYYTEKQNDTYLRYCIQPIENALGHIAKIWIFDSAIESISHGRNVGAPGISKLENFKKNDTVAVLSLMGELVAIGKAQMSAVEINTKRKGVALAVEKVFWQH